MEVPCEGEPYPLHVKEPFTLFAMREKGCFSWVGTERVYRQKGVKIVKNWEKGYPNPYA